MNLLVEQTELTSLLQNSSGNIFVWQRFLEQVAVRLNCDSSALLVTDLAQPENTRFLFTANTSEEHQERYETELTNLDAFNQFISNNPLEVFCNQNLKVLWQTDKRREYSGVAGEVFEKRSDGRRRMAGQRCW